MTTKSAVPEIQLSKQELEDFKKFLPQALETKEENSDEVTFASEPSEQYVEVLARWWGITIVLSPQAVADLGTGQAGVAAVIGAISAAAAIVPGVGTLLSAMGGIAAAIIGAHAAVIQSVNRGKGVYLNAPWPSITIPTLWVPTPR